MTTIFTNDGDPRKYVERLAWERVNTHKSVIRTGMVSDVLSKEIAPPEPRIVDNQFHYEFVSKISPLDLETIVFGFILLTFLMILIADPAGPFAGLEQLTIEDLALLVFVVPSLHFIAIVLDKYRPEKTESFVIAQKGLSGGGRRRALVMSFWIKKSGFWRNRFTIDRRMYHSLKEGDTVTIHYYPWRHIVKKLVLITSQPLLPSDPVQSILKESDELSRIMRPVFIFIMILLVLYAIFLAINVLGYISIRLK